MTSDSSSLLKRSHPYMCFEKKQSHLASEKSASTCMQENATLMLFLDVYEKQVSAHKRENSRQAGTSFLGPFDFRLFAAIQRFHLLYRKQALAFIPREEFKTSCHFSKPGIWTCSKDKSDKSLDVMPSLFLRMHLILFIQTPAFV